MKVITTNTKENKYWEESAADSRELSCMQAVCLYPELKMNTIHGFGDTFTEKGATSLLFTLNAGNREKEAFIKACFSDEGLRYTLGRTHINSCDFSLSRTMQLHEDPEDTELKKFSLDREEKYILPLIKAAQSQCGGNLKFLLSPWSPPAFMKTNNEMNHGGYLKEEYYERWAQYMVRFIKEYEARGVQVSWVTVQTEPDAVQTWDSCKYSAAQEGVFAGKYLVRL